MSTEPDNEGLPSRGLFGGKVAVVTGAAHGLGRSVAVELARRGARVVAVDIMADELQETLKAMASVGRGEGTSQIMRVDVTNEHEVNACVAKTLDRFGQIDILVNNAGGVDGQTFKPVETVTAGEWARIVDINLNGVFYFIRGAAAPMKARRYGRIVNVSSGAGRSYSLTGIQAYASAKAGQIGLTRQMARELGPFNITVNNVAPGFIRSNPTTEKQWADMGERGQRELLQAISLRKLGTPEDVAYAVLFFASDYAGHITGQTLSVDGGHHMF